ncbi:hypothetical protein ABT404_02290 [Streptomyces hyaluromycini]|uniref:Uncharacterized protein n=1 Tax=Streptomyces hyaluromycini TaxID=1377993 RepID=A0ABV1WP97_9ACTN
MITVPAVPADLAPHPGWETVPTARGRTAAGFRLCRDGVTVDVRLERCAEGRLRDAFPAGARDLELRVAAGCPEHLLPALLRSLTAAVRDADPHCRRVVLALPVADRGGIDAAGSAGYRYAVDVDLGHEELALLVAEPDWVTVTDIDLDRVPGA